MEDQFYCLGIKALGLCSYNPAKPNGVYFSIGEAVAAITLVLAFAQLLKPEFEFKLRIKNIQAKIAAIFFFIAIVFVLIAAILPSISGCALPLLGYPIFWELLAGILIITAAGMFGHIYFSEVLFNKKNYNRFFERCYSIIARGKDEEVRALADTIRFSASNIIEACSEYDREDADNAKSEGRKYPVSERVGYAFDLLDLFSDRKFCRIIVESSPATAIAFVDQMIRHNYYNGGGSFIEQLVKQAFLSEESILQREENFLGLGHFQPFTKTVFGNYQFVESKGPLNACKFYKDEYSRRNIIEKYSKAVQTALTGYFEDGRFYDRPFALYGAMEDQLADAARVAIGKLKIIPDDIVYNSEAYDILTEISSSFRSLIQIIQDSEGKIPKDYKFDEKSYDPSKDNSIYGVIALGIYKFIETLTIVKVHEEPVRQILLPLWNFDRSSQPQSHVVNEIQKRLSFQLQQKMSQNLDNLYYPMVTRLMILINLSCFWESNWEGKFMAKDTLDLVGEKIKHAFEISEEKAKEILPQNVRYVKETHILVYENKYTGKSYELKLKE